MTEPNGASRGLRSRAPRGLRRLRSVESPVSRRGRRPRWLALDGEGSGTQTYAAHGYCALHVGVAPHQARSLTCDRHVHKGASTPHSRLRCVLAGSSGGGTHCDSTRRAWLAGRWPASRSAWLLAGGTPGCDRRLISPLSSRGRCTSGVLASRPEMGERAAVEVYASPCGDTGCAEDRVVDGGPDE